MMIQNFDTPPGTLIRRALFSMASLLLVTVWMIPSAIASPNDRNLTARFSKLQVAQGDHKIAIKYSLTPSSWNAFRRAKIEPRLNIYSLDHRKARYVYRYSTKLRSRSGTITYARKDIRLRQSKTVEIQVVGFRGTKQIARSVHGKQTAKRLRLVVRDKREHACEDDDKTVKHPKKPHRKRDRGPRSARQADIIRACDANTTFDSEMNKCLLDAKKLTASNPVAIINTCGQATFFNSDFRKCLDGAAKIAVAPAATIKACDDVTDFGADFGRCLTKSASYKHTNPAPVVRACGRHTDFGSDLGKCIDSARGVHGNRAKVVDICGRATNFGSELLGCVERSRRRRT